MPVSDEEAFDIIDAAYRDPKIGLRSKQDLFNKLKRSGITMSQIESYLKFDETHQIKTAVRNSSYTSIRAYSVGDVIQVDLMDMSNLKTKNKGITFLLNIVDVYSRKAWSYPMPNKSEYVVALHFRQFLIDMKFKVRNITCDSGSEFNNKTFKTIAAREHATLYLVPRDTPNKLAIVERFNRTLRSMIDKYLTQTGQTNYVDRLRDIIYNYNNSEHRTLCATPEEIFAGVKSSCQVFSAPKNPFNLGDVVRLAKKKATFTKGTQEFTKELYHITNVNNHSVEVTNIRTNTPGNRRYQLYEVRLVEPVRDTADDAVAVVKKMNKVVRNQKKEFDNVNETTGEIIIQPRLAPKSAKRLAKKIARYHPKRS